MPQARRPVHARPSSVLAVAGLGLLGVAALALSAYAITSNVAPETAGSVPEAPSFTEATPTTDQASAPATEVAAAPRRVLAASDEPGHLLRASTPGCGAGDARVEVSFDDGVSWQQTMAFDIPMAAVRQIEAGDGSTTRVAALDEACQPVQARSFTGGLDWEPDVDGTAMWVLSDDSTTVQAPQGPVALPCAAVSVLGASDRAIALCGDTGVTITEDSGLTWSVPQPIDGAAAVGLMPSGFVVSSVGEPECQGIRTRLINAQEFAAPGACVVVQMEAGAIALTGSADTLYLWAGEQILRSIDGGANWA